MKLEVVVVPVSDVGRDVGRAGSRRPGRVAGAAPESRRSGSFASFSDTGGNG